jgi:hypothetical protein
MRRPSRAMGGPERRMFSLLRAWLGGSRCHGCGPSSGGWSAAGLQDCPTIMNVDRIRGGETFTWPWQGMCGVGAADKAKQRARVPLKAPSVNFAPVPSDVPGRLAVRSCNRHRVAPGAGWGRRRYAAE